jgi:hypothetical protein
MQSALLNNFRAYEENNTGVAHNVRKITKITATARGKLSAAEWVEQVLTHCHNRVIAETVRRRILTAKTRNRV